MRARGQQPRTFEHHAILDDERGFERCAEVKHNPHHAPCWNTPRQVPRHLCKRLQHRHHRLPCTAPQQPPHRTARAGRAAPHTLMRRAGLASPASRSRWRRMRGPCGSPPARATTAATGWRQRSRCCGQARTCASPWWATRRGCPPMRSDALARAQAAGVPIVNAGAPPLDAQDLAIDALLGLGASRAPQGADRRPDRAARRPALPGARGRPALRPGRAHRPAAGRRLRARHAHAVAAHAQARPLHRPRPRPRRRGLVRRARRRWHADAARCVADRRRRCACRPARRAGMRSTRAASAMSPSSAARRA